MVPQSLTQVVVLTPASFTWMDDEALFVTNLTLIISHFKAHIAGLCLLLWPYVQNSTLDHQPDLAFMWSGVVSLWLLLLLLLAGTRRLRSAG